MAEVAKHAGVGIGTVSRVFSGSPKVSDTTRTKVQTAAELLGYHRPRKAAAEQGKGGRLIAVLRAVLRREVGLSADPRHRVASRAARL